MDEFKDFLNNESVSPNKSLDEKVLNHVQRDLKITPTQLFLKIFGIHTIVGLLTLLFCPQFELSLTNNHEVFHFFHRTFGPYICMMICGVIFVGTGSLLVGGIINFRDLSIIHKHPFLYFSGITGFFILGFIIFGAKIYLESVLFWALGSILSSVIFFECIRLIRKLNFQK
ncbi:MAG: hypothetical protein OEY33_04485 [Bdellovibrionales bacterium]|jgi:hypothetical protein|nr:hypothetical protein [Bdellovibrionales bacterium]